jgi:hypothetical protein
MVEAKARLYREIMQAAAVPEEYRHNPIWSEDQNVEMAVRVLVRRELPEILSGCISTADLMSLDEVFFDIIYPTVPTREPAGF